MNEEIIIPTDITNCKLYTVVNGEMQEFCNVANIEVTPDSSDDDKLIEMLSSREATFTIDVNSKSYKKTIRRLYRGTNNWRKMHGLPLHRYL